jgi:hypothetical protein
MHGISKTLAIALETVGVCAILLGVGIEVYYEADIGFIAITSGSAVVAVGGMIFAKLVHKK